MNKEKENSIVQLTETMSEQDNKQKMAMYTGFAMEFYRVLMGSFLIVFVPWAKAAIAWAPPILYT